MPKAGPESEDKKGVAHRDIRPRTSAQAADSMGPVLSLQRAAGNRAVAGAFSRASGRAADSTGPLVSLQGAAGNRAVAGALAVPSTPVQRLMQTTSSDLGKLVSASDVIKGAVGKSSEEKKAFAGIRKALADYQSTAKKGKGGLELQVARLEALDLLCERFIKDHPGDRRRRSEIMKLQDDIAAERASVTQQQAQGIYQGAVENRGQPGGFKALSTYGWQGATKHDVEIAEPGAQGPKRDQRIKALKAKYKLTDAEISAITVYSAGDFSYINPVTANSSSWLESQKKDTTDAWGKLDDKTLKEEGSLHTGMAMQGLNKIDPYPGETYRGARFTPEDFRGRFAVGKTMSFTALSSSSKNEDIALNFIYGLSAGSSSDPKKTVGVLTVLSNAGGRDISEIALVQKEAEVLLLPGSFFEVVSVEAIDGNSKYAEKAEEASQRGKPLPTSWYVVRLKPTKKPPEEKAKTPWKGAQPQASTNPFALPKEVGILGLDRARPNRARSRPGHRRNTY